MAGRGGKGTGAARAARAAAVKRTSRAEAAEAATRAARTRATHTAAAYKRLVSAQARNPHAYQGSLRLPGLTQKAEATLRAHLSELRTAKVQHALVIDAKSGQVLVDKSGTRSSVSLSFRPSTDTEKSSERERAAGNVYVLSHPASSATRANANAPTFSPSEYEDIISRARAGAAYVVTPTGVASLRPGANGWPSYATVKSILDRAFASHLSALQAAQARKSGASKRLTEKLSRVTAGDVLHLAWKDVARQTGLRYSRTGYSTRKTYEMDLMDHPLAQIRRGTKTQEGRLGSGLNRTIRVGDVLNFNGGRLHAEVTSVSHSRSASDMVRKAGLSALGFDPRSGDTHASAADVYEHIYWYANPTKARAGSRSTWRDQGWIAFGVRPVSAEKANEPAPSAAATPRKRGRR